MKKIFSFLAIILLAFSLHAQGLTFASLSGSGLPGTVDSKIGWVIGVDYVSFGNSPDKFTILPLINYKLLNQTIKYENGDNTQVKIYRFEVPINFGYNILNEASERFRFEPFVGIVPIFNCSYTAKHTTFQVLDREAINLFNLGGRAGLSISFDQIGIHSFWHCDFLSTYNQDYTQNVNGVEIKPYQGWNVKNSYWGLGLTICLTSK